MIDFNPNFKKLRGGYVFKEVSDRVKKTGRDDLISLSIGDSVFPIPKYVTDKMKVACDQMALKKTFKGYPPTDGYPFLKDAVCRLYATHGVRLSLEEVFISDGAKSDVDRLIDLFSPSTAVLHDPTYPAYRHALTVKGFKIIDLPALEKNGFLPLPCDLSDEAKNQTGHLIYICSPDNPTGAHYSADGLKSWVDFAIRTGSVIIYDSAYSYYVNGGVRSIFQIQGASRCAIEVSSLSKLGGFTGIRCGWSVIPKDLALNGEGLNGLFALRQSGMFNGVSYVTQVGAAALLDRVGFKAALKSVKRYIANARTVKNALLSEGVAAFGAENSPYVWAKCVQNQKSFDFFDRLLSYGVVCTPGVGFGPLGEGYFRLTGFIREEDLYPAIERLSACIRSYRG